MILDIIQLFTGFYLLVGLCTMMGKAENIVETVEKAGKDNDYGPVMQLWVGFYLTVGSVLIWPRFLGMKK